MSQGKFEQGVYEADNAQLHICRYQPETRDATFGGLPNSINGGNATSPLWVKLKPGAKEWGLKPRKVRIRWTGAPPTGYKADTTVELVVFTPDSFAAIVVNGGAVYLDTAAQVVGKTSEKYYPEI